MNPYTIGSARVSKDPPPRPVLPSRLLAYYRLRPPSPLVLPGTGEQWDARFGGALPPPSAIYPCVEESGDLVDWLHPADIDRKLAPFGEESPLYRRRAVGLRANGYDGPMTIHPTRGVELPDPYQHFEAPNGTLFDVGAGESIVLLAVFRCTRRHTDEDPFLSIASKQGPDDVAEGGEAVGGVVTGGPGFAFGIDSSGYAMFRAQPAREVEGRVTSPGRVDDGAWHCAVVSFARFPVVKGEGGEIERILLYMNTDQGKNQLPYPATSLLDLSNDQPFCLGSTELELYRAAHLQVAYLAAWHGALTPFELNTLLGDDGALERFWTAHRRRRNLIEQTGGELGFKRLGGALGWPAGTDPFGDGNCVAKYSAGGSLPGAGVPIRWPAQYPYTVMGDEADLARGGFGSNSGGDIVGNLLLHSEELTARDWTTSGSGISVEANADDAPDGMRTAEQATFSSGATSWIAQTARVRSMVEDPSYTASIWVRLRSGFEEGAILYLGGVAEQTTDLKAFALSGSSVIEENKWVRIHAPVVPSAVEGSVVELGLEVAVEVPGTADPVVLDLWGAQLADCEYPGPYSPTTATAEYQWDEARLFAQLNREPSPYEIGPKGHVSFVVRLPYETDQANDRALITIQGQTTDGGDGIEKVVVRVVRKNSGRIVFEVEDATAAVHPCSSLYAYGVGTDEGADQAVEVPVELGWDFSDTENTMWLQVADEDRQVTGIGTPPLGFEALYFCIGPGAIIGFLTPYAGPDAQLYEVKVYKP